MPGSANELHAKWKKICADSLAKPSLSFSEFKRNIRGIVHDFDQLPLLDIQKPKVGIVGEILVKFLPASARIGNLAIWFLEKLRKPMIKELSKSKRFTPPSHISELAKLAEPVTSIGNQTGEGWFLTGEMLELIHSGVPNIVCAQPFGCLPNHVVGKGVIKELRHRHPEANIVAVDYDPGASEVNQLNRIKLMLSTANKNLEKIEKN